MSDEAGRASFASVLAVREFRWLWSASVQSLAGDQLARVALAVLVYARTGSGLWTAVTYALTFLPAFFGGLFLGGIADRYSRRGVIVTCDLVRASLFATMALPHVPLALLVVLLTCATVIGAVFQAAEPALVADLFDGPRYSTALSLRTVTFQGAQLLGFGAGGVIVAVVGARPALLVDAVTFLVSAGLLRTGLQARPAAAAGDDSHRGPGSLLAGVRLVSANRALLVLIGFAGLTALWVIPEGLAAPYAAMTGGGAAATGILMAAIPVGNVLGALAFARLSRAWQRKVLAPLAVLAGVPLIACGPEPGLVGTIALWALAGVFTACLIQVNAEYIGTAPAEHRGQAIGVLNAAILTGQGLGLLLGGALSQAASPAAAIAAAGGIATTLALALAFARARLSHHMVAEPADPVAKTVSG